MSERPPLNQRIGEEEGVGPVSDDYGPICEANYFATTPEGFSAHFKLIAPYIELIGLTQQLQDEFILRGYTGGAHGQARSSGGAPAAAPKSAGEDCPFCDTPTVEKISSAKKPYLSCPNCNAVAPYKEMKSGKWAWREDRPK